MQKNEELNVAFKEYESLSNVLQSSERLTFSCFYAVVNEPIRNEDEIRMKLPSVKIILLHQKRLENYSSLALLQLIETQNFIFLNTGCDDKLTLYKGAFINHVDYNGRTIVQHLLFFKESTNDQNNCPKNPEIIST